MKRINIPITNEKLIKDIKGESNEDKLRKYRLSPDSIAHFRSQIKIVNAVTSRYLGAKLYTTIYNKDYDEKRDLNIVIDLILAGANVNYFEPASRSLLLHLAVKRNHLWTFITLVRAGAYINISDKDGNSTLMLATIPGYKEIVEILILLGANIETKNKYGFTAADIARINKKQDCLTLLENVNKNITENDPDALIKEAEAKLKEITEDDNLKLVKKKSSFKRIY